MNKIDLNKLKDDYYYLLDHYRYCESLELVCYWINVFNLEKNNAFRHIAAERARDLIFQYTQKNNITIVPEGQIVLMDAASIAGENDTTVELKL